MFSPSRQRIFDDLSQMVAFESVHVDSSLRAHYEVCAQWVHDAFVKVGATTQIIEGIDKSLAILGEIPGDPANERTVLLYAHHDIVPLGPREDWDHEPLEITEKDGRWWGRGTADCKGHIAMHLEVLRLIKDAPNLPTIKFVIEGSEENGGLGLKHLLEERPELFEAEAIFVVDTGNAEPGVPSIVTLQRGSAQIRVHCETMEAPVHSGKFGGAAVDAVAALIRTLDSVRDEEGRCVIDGVDCTGEWGGEEYPEEKFRADTGMLDGTELPEGDIASFIWARPAVSITGFSSTPVEDAINAVPATAQAHLNLRVPPRQRNSAGKRITTAKTAKLLIEHLQKHTPWGAQVDAEILAINRSYAADEDGEILNLLRECMSDAYGMDASEIGTGGSIPLTVELHEAFPDSEIALFGAADLTSAIHSPQESVDPAEIEHMVQTEALFLTRFH
ncbi:M20/M25/M40 family metallo-hydrolase [Corynebacterium stationis]|uniref:M20/M25/M40 family metallo-hydrolase n=1 Tax=Corynebacterium stationis TaxID=1705 RepID=UPI00174C70B7|nr:M20/M25/M40 family metallo-hydrolase [Corynebacterium stationis]